MGLWEGTSALNFRCVRKLSLAFAPTIFFPTRTGGIFAASSPIGPQFFGFWRVWGIVSQFCLNNCRPTPSEQALMRAFQVSHGP